MHPTDKPRCASVVSPRGSYRCLSLLLIPESNTAIQHQRHAAALPCHCCYALQHIALTIGEEVDLHTRLLEDLDEDVDVTHTRLRAATKRVRHVIKHSSNWKGGLFIFMLIIVLTLLLLIVFKVIKLFH